MTARRITIDFDDLHKVATVTTVDSVSGVYIEPRPDSTARRQGATAPNKAKPAVQSIVPLPTKPAKPADVDRSDSDEATHQATRTSVTGPSDSTRIRALVDQLARGDRSTALCAPCADQHRRRRRGRRLQRRRPRLPRRLPSGRARFRPRRRARSGSTQPGRGPAAPRDLGVAAPRRGGRGAVARRRTLAGGGSVRITERIWSQIAHFARRGRHRLASNRRASGSVHSERRNTRSPPPHVAHRWSAAVFSKLVDW